MTATTNAIPTHNQQPEPVDPSDGNRVAIDITAPAPISSLLVRSAAIIFAAAASVNAAFQFWSLDNLPGMITDNTITFADRRTMLLSMGVTGMVALIFASAYLLRKRTRAAVEKVDRIACIVSPLILSFAVPIFFNWRVFRNDTFSGALLITLWGLLLERSLRLSFTALDWPKVRRAVAIAQEAAPRFWRWLPVVLVVGFALFFAGYFSYYTILHHRRMQTQSFDMAIFNNIMWNLVRGKWFKASPVMGRLGSHIHNHANFIAYLFTPFYALYQKAESLLVIQATIDGLAAIPIYLLAKKRLRTAAGALVLAFAYGIHGPLHGPIFYDFHFLTLAPFFISWMLYAFESGKKGWLIVGFVLALLVREDLPVGIAMACLFYLVCGDRTRWAFWGGVISSIYFVVVKFIIMPNTSSGGMGGETYTYIFSGLIPASESGFGAVLRTLATNPIYALKFILQQEKLEYVLRTLGPVLLLPVRNARAWMLVAPAVIFTILSTGYKPTYQTTFQYTTHWTSYLFFATAVTLGSWRLMKDGPQRIAAAIVAIAITASAQSYQMGAIFQHNTFHGGFRQVSFERSEQDRQNYRDINELIALIPPKASVAATETEAPHVSSREDCFTMRFGYNDADYLLVDVSDASSGQSHESMTTALNTGLYGFVSQKGKYALWGKGQPHDRDALGAAIIHVQLKK